VLAILLSLAAAVAFAASAMQIDSVTGRVGPLQLSRWQIGLAFLMTAALSLGLGGWRTIDPEAFIWLAGSSAVGIMFASLTFVATIQMTGPRISALLFTTASPFALALGYVFRGETVSLPQGAGVALIILGIVLAILGPKGDDGPREARPIWLGVGLGLLTALGQATGSLLARPAMLSGADPVAAMAVRTGFGAAFFVALLAVPRLRPQIRPSPQALWHIAGAALSGMVVGMSFLMAALARGDVGIVTTLSSTTPILFLPMVWAVSGAMPRLTAWVGAALAVAGTALISLAT
jgi:drug/metabolite transporter (DMT)-like permease